MARKGENIYKRSDGRYEARYITCRDDSGKAVYKSVYGRSKAEVREKVENARREIYGEASPLKGKTFKQVAEEYLEDAKSTIASTTYDRYLDALERDIYPEYADTPMSDVTSAEIKRFLKVATESASRRGRSLTKSGLMVIKAVMSNVINYANAAVGFEKAEINWDRTSYEELTAQEIEMLCFKAKHNHCPELLAALLSLFCGMRTGELCALKSEDVDSLRNEIYIHETAHRVRNPKRGEDGENRTIIIVEEIPRKKQIRRVSYPSVLNDYIDEFRMPGKPLIRNSSNEQTDPRTLENWLKRIMSVFRMKEIVFERLRKTYMKGKADEQVLNYFFLGIRPDSPYANRVDVKWLTEELSRDLTSLRLLIGLSLEEAADILGVSVGMYRQLENGSRIATWDQYMSILFFYHYNMRTTEIVSNLGLYPDSLKEKIRIGEV
ncbi:phage integrase central domain-containing protein [Butyrivibrio sp. NC3005]|uniref:phage integrase central domain-containing protein n=1 Tax=Butyrivibrio sp. NC3005 TaxID=1280685 RepID=UPI000416B0E5|nr:tyrosine-type recombinase/integrase [Butyrivibrio sp. NC3005]